MKFGYLLSFIVLILLTVSTVSGKPSRNVAETHAFLLEPRNTRALEFNLFEADRGFQVTVAFRAFLSNKEMDGYSKSVHITVNRQMLRVNILKRSRLLNKPMRFQYGPRGVNEGAWGADVYRTTDTFNGSALWTVARAPSLNAVIESQDFAPEGLNDPSFMLIDISDLVKHGAQNTLRIHNVDWERTLSIDNLRVIVREPLSNAEEVNVLSRKRRRKSEPTYYIPDRINCAKENIKNHTWAQGIFNRIMKGDQIRYYIGPEYMSAEEFAAQSDEFMWMLQPSTKLKRHVIQEVEVLKCPVHGWKGKKYNAWCPWKIDPIRKPYKIQCMVGNEWYPSNDYHLGDMTSGDFPDDGTGILYNGERFKLLGEYAHMVYGSVVVPCLTTLSQAWLLTGEKVYAQKGCILLARLASEYPNHEDRRDRLYDQRDLKKKNDKSTGMITDTIWSTIMFEKVVYAYDALFNYMDDPGLLHFLKSKDMPVDSGDDLRAYIEDNLIRAGMKALLQESIKGNEGHHQAAALACALVIDDFADTRVNTMDMVDYAYHGIGHTAYILTNALTPDGGGHESPNYNRIKLDFIRVARLMEEIRSRNPGRFPKDKNPDIFGEPKGQALFDYNIDVFMLDYFIPSIGDCGGINSPTRIVPQQSRSWSEPAQP